MCVGAVTAEAVGNREAAVAAIAANNAKFAENNAKRMKLLRSQEKISEDDDDDNNNNDDDDDDYNDDDNDNGVNLQNLDPTVAVNILNENKDANKIVSQSQQKERETENLNVTGKGEETENRIDSRIENKKGMKQIHDALMASVMRNMLATEGASRKRELVERDKSKTDQQ